MLAENLVEEFEMKEEEPWYDHRDLQQGEGAVAPRAGGLDGEAPGCETVKKLVSLGGWRTSGAGMPGAHLAWGPGGCPARREAASAQ